MIPFLSEMEFWLAVSCENFIVTAAVSGEGCKRIWSEGSGGGFYRNTQYTRRVPSNK